MENSRNCLYYNIQESVIEDRLYAAVEYFVDTRGMLPTVIHLHPHDHKQVVHFGICKLQPSETILPGHYWMEA